MKISNIQYITNYQSEIPHLDQVKQVLDAGVKWIQYRPKEMAADLVYGEGREIASLCQQYGATFIMNDDVDMAKKLNTDGVHLGKSDRQPKEAREILGETKIVGGTANTIEDILNLLAQGVNYIGLGPFRFTKTKKNLSPVLGIEGYAEIINSLNSQELFIPIIAIGGIKEKDVEPLLNTGVHGVAISSLISDSDNLSLKAKELLNTININR